MRRRAGNCFGIEFRCRRHANDPLGRPDGRAAKALHAVHADADAEEQLNRGEQSDVRTLWCLCHAIPATGVPPHGFELDYPSRLLGDRRSRHITVQGYVIVDSKDLAGSWSR